MNVMSEWELLKENVEPLKSGRSMKTLKSALNEKPNDVNAREERRRQFESDLRTYEGSDLLSVYYEYIVWVEQNYPLGGNEANFKTLLEKCIEQFYASEDYRNDERLLKIFLKLIKRVDSPLELFAFFNEQGFATSLADFYINWAFHLENNKNCRKAADILRKGINENAEPKTAIQRTLQELEVRVAKAIVNDKADELNENDNETKQRQPLNKLKSKSTKGKAPVKRVGKAVKNGSDGLKTAANSKNGQIKAPEIYCDENNPNVEAVMKKPDPPAATKSVKAITSVGQENEQKPGKWSENVLTQKAVPSATQPKFAIHADDSDEESPEPVRKPPQANTLKVRPHNADSPPIARFEKPDPFKKYAFNMNKVYAGGEEFSFEEIRARKWVARKKREEERQRNHKLEEEVAELRRQVELLLKARETASQEPVPAKKPLISEEHLKERTTSPVPSSAESSTAKSGTNSSANATNTALSMMRDMWNGTLANATAEDMNPRVNINAVIDKGEELVHKSKETPFAIFSDTTIMSKKNDKKLKPRESTGFADYTIAMPKSDETFFAKISCSSTPVADKAKKLEYNAEAIAPLLNQYNFVGGMTAKLSPIVETSREYNSKSSSSSSGATTTTMSSTGASAVSRRQRALSGVENIDPFDTYLLTQLLDSVVEPIDSRKGFYRMKTALPHMKPEQTSIKLGSDRFKVKKLVATGAYAQVFSAHIEDSSDSMTSQSVTKSGLNPFVTQNFFALKVAKNANEWEFYICDELQKRLHRSKNLPDIELSVMSANPTVMFKDGCVLVDEFVPNGTLIDVVNVLKAQNKPFPKSLIAYFALELILIVQQIHSHRIIHADLKPDNILILNFPYREDILNVMKTTSCLKVIDFGRSIDMSLFPEGTTFNVNVTTKGSQCCEMLDSKPWNYQTDWFGVLDAIHVMLFGEYIKVHKNKDQKWDISEKFRRYHQTEIWKPLFEVLLNIPNCDSFPDLSPFVKALNQYVKENMKQIIKDSNEVEKINDAALIKKK